VIKLGDSSDEFEKNDAPSSSEDYGNMGVEIGRNS